MEEREDEIVVLLDENGEEVEFEHLDTILMNDNEYVVLLPVQEEENEEAVDEVIILRVEHGEDGEDTFASVENEVELTEVFEEFKSRMEEEYEFSDEEEEAEEDDGEEDDGNK